MTHLLSFSGDSQIPSSDERKLFEEDIIDNFKNFEKLYLASELYQ